jgi:peptidoglycan LD-endopeptidase LytH
MPSVSPSGADAHGTARLVVVVLMLALLVTVPGIGRALELDTARDEAARLRTELDEVTLRYEQALAGIELTNDELVGLKDREREFAALFDDIDARLAERARETYKHGSTGTFDLLLTGDDPAEALERAELISTVQQRDSAGLEEAEALRDALAQTRALVLDRRDRMAALEQDLEAARTELGERLGDAELVVESLEQMVARQRQISHGQQQGVYACPLDPSVTHFIDSWGFPRSGGRGHRGTDVMGPMGAPVYAFASGVVDRHTNSRLGGISLYLRGDDGATYFYTHLQGFAPRGAVGTRVQAGEHIAYNGNTGNARGGSPHIHFERHPGGGSAVNPYSWLAAACF